MMATLMRKTLLVGNPILLGLRSGGTKPNAKMAVLPVIRGQNVMKLGRIDPWPYQRVPNFPFGFLATRGSSLFSK